MIIQAKKKVKQNISLSIALDYFLLTNFTKTCLVMLIPFLWWFHQGSKSEKFWILMYHQQHFIKYKIWYFERSFHRRYKGFKLSWINFTFVIIIIFFPFYQNYFYFLCLHLLIIQCFCHCQIHLLLQIWLY